MAGSTLPGTTLADGFFICAKILSKQKSQIYCSILILESSWLLLSVSIRWIGASIGVESVLERYLGSRS